MRTPRDGGRPGSRTQPVLGGAGQGPGVPGVPEGLPDQSPPCPPPGAFLEGFFTEYNHVHRHSGGRPAHTGIGPLRHHQRDRRRPPGHPGSGPRRRTRTLRQTTASTQVPDPSWINHRPENYRRPELDCLTCLDSYWWDREVDGKGPLTRKTRGRPQWCPSGWCEARHSRRARSDAKATHAQSDRCGGHLAPNCRFHACSGRWSWDHGFVATDRPLGPATAAGPGPFEGR
jgi:hypothetical protein